MYETILDKLAQSAPRKIKDEHARLNGEVKRFIGRIKSKSSKPISARSLRGGLQSMGARGVFVKDGDVYTRRVIVKASYLNSSDEKSRARIRHHLTYVGRATDDERQDLPELYASDDSLVVLKEKIEDFKKSDHIFNIIVSPEDGDKLDLKRFTRDLINIVEQDLQTKLDWVAGNHYDTDNPHVHILIKGLDDTGKKLLMTRDYISRGIRARACQVANRHLGLRTQEEIVESLKLNLSSNKKTALDEILLKNAQDNQVCLKSLARNSEDELPRFLFERRLQFLEEKNLASKLSSDRWELKETLLDGLRQIHRTSSIIQKISGSVSVDKDACEIVSFASLSDRSISGHVIKRGYVDKHGHKEFLLVKSKEKKLLYVELEKFSEKSPAKSGEFVRIDVTKPFAGPLTSDKTIQQLALSNVGIYDAAQHARNLESKGSLPPGVSPREYVQVHLNRLEVLARKGLVEKISDGAFKIPSDYLDRLSLEAKKASSGYQPHIKVIRLSPARLKSTELHRGLSR